MKPLTAPDIKGTWGAVLLPIREDESIDFGRLEDEITALLQSGIDGVYTNGTAAEFYAQSEDEFDRIHDLLARRCERVGMPFQVGASHPCAQTSLERIRRARQWAPGAIQVILPDWYPVTDCEAIRFLDRAAEVASPVGLVLYNPPHAKRVLEPDAYQLLSDRVSSLVGIKTGGGGDEWWAGMKGLIARLSIFVPGHALASGWRRGASGSYSNVACLHPVFAKRWNQRIETDRPGALDVEERIQRFLRDYIEPFRTRDGVSNQGLDKLLAAVGGWSDVGLRLRWPYSWVPAEAVPPLREAARELIPEMFEVTGDPEEVQGL